jgi:sensor domain CHASE-containing protein
VKKPRKIFLVATALVTLVALSLYVVSALARVSLYIDLDEQVKVGFKGSVPIRTKIEKPVQVAIDERVEAGVFLGEKLSVPLK